MASHPSYDVAISGASIAGSVAAIRYGRAGLRVALLEKSPNPDHFKRACTHTIAAGTVPLLEELGLGPELEAVRAPFHKWELYTRYGWIRGDLDGYQHPKWNCTVRREVLDPMLRRHAAATPGVDLLAGWKVEDLIRRGRRVTGLVARDRTGERTEIDAQLVVGADGRASKVAEAAGMRERRRRHERFAYWGYFENVRLTTHPDSQIYFLDPDCAYLMSTDSGLSILVMAVHKRNLPEFRRDPDAFYWKFISSLPGAPRLDRAKQVGKFVGRMDMTNHSRRVAAPGLALSGDAAMAVDPVWGWGCGWALKCSTLLAETTAQALRDRRGLDRALLRYRVRHARMFAGSYQLAADYSRGRRFNPAERVIFAAAPHDREIARHVHSYVTSSIGVARLIAPGPMLRAARVYLSHLPQIHLGADVPAPEPSLLHEPVV